MPQYRLIGSLTSPYVRRFRLYLNGTPHEMDVTKDIYGADDARLSAINPMKRVPVLLIDGRPLFESRVIFQHLRQALGRPALSLEEENALSTVDTLQDQLVQGFLMKRDKHPIHEENGYFRRHAERRRLILDYLRAETIAGRFDRWDYPAMSLYSLIDWSLFRGALTDADVDGPLARFFEASKTRPAVADSDPRKA